MQFDRFARRAEEILAGIPGEFLAGIVGVEVHRRSLAHPHVPGVFTLGECVDDEVTRMTDPGALRSRLHLYHGSFRSLAAVEPGFDWEGELRETVLHEVRHHIEDRAGIKDLLEEDAEEEALARFDAGEEMPPGWYRGGERMERDVYRVGDDLFVEFHLRRSELARLPGGPVRLEVLGEPLVAEIPGDVEPDEILTFAGEGLERAGRGHGDLHLVVRVVGGA